jgi:hypothetical protein
MNQNDMQANDSPATLVAIIVAARRAGDRELERESRRRLRQRFGVNLIFLGQQRIIRGASLGAQPQPEA